MRSLLLRRGLTATLATLAAVTLATPLSSPALAATSDPAAATQAATWLAGQLTDAGTVVGSFPGSDDQPVTYTDYGQTLDAALGLLAAGAHDDVLGRALTTVTTPGAVKEYTQGAPGDRADAAYAGATAKLAFTVAATGGDPADVGGVDLLAQLLSLVTPAGRLADRSDFGNYANLFGHAFALLALDQAGRTPSDALVQGLLSAQCSDGSFPEAYEPKTGGTCTGSVDATGLVLQALAATNRASSDAVQRAVSWLGTRQQSDGGYAGQAPVNSTAYAVLGLAAVGADTTRAVAYLTSQQNPDGGLRRGTTGTPPPGSGATTASDVFATAQALPALLGTPFQAAARAVARQAVPCTTAAVNLPVATTHAAERAVVSVTGASGTVVDLFAYSRPSTEYSVVRTVTIGRGGSAGLTISPSTNTRLYAQQRGCTAGSSVVLSVRTVLTLAVARNGVRTYTFSGKSLPARAGGLIVSLYRVNADGSSVLTSQTRANATTGAWSVRRTFSGSGRFGFVVRTGADLQNAPGASNARSLLVY